MPRHKGSKNLSDKEIKDYNRKRAVVIKKMPRTYSALLNRYYIQSKKQPIASHRIYAFMDKKTFSEEILKTLSDFTENFLPNNQ